MSARVRIAVFGAGSIGCWVGGRLAAGGAEVVLIGRPRVMDEVAQHGLRVSDLDGYDRSVSVETATSPDAAMGAAIVVVTVKSAGTAEVARALDAVLPAGAVVVSMQNGIRNAGVLRDALAECHVLAGMVPFNVVRRTPGAYHRASAGTLMIERSPHGAPLVAAARAAELAIEERDDMTAVQWAKLVLNLNNAINALSGQPLAVELAQRDYRRCLAAAQREALTVLAAAKQPLAKLTAVPPRWMPRLLSMPDRVFRRVARRVVAIDPHARSSMWDDLEAQRPTEIDYIQGEIVALAATLGVDAPINRRLVGLVRGIEAGERRTFTPAELRTALGV
jgi:2-dehydropantoate 2-reductase